METKKTCRDDDTSDLAAAAPSTTSSSNKKPKQEHVRVGVGVLVQDASRQGAIFAGIRKGSHGAGRLALPGGHLEMYETWQECAIREVKEEMNLDLEPTSIQFGHVTNDIMKSEDKHYVTIFMMGRCSTTNSVPLNMEPDKCEGWKSYTWQELQDILHANDQRSTTERQQEQQPILFGPLKKLVEDNPDSVQKFLMSQ